VGKGRAIKLRKLLKKKGEERYIPELGVAFAILGYIVVSSL
jgi:hypothetical protein